MSQKISKLNLKEKIILNAHLEAKSEEGADTLQGLLLAIKTNAEVAEPGCLTFRICRFKTLLMVFEEYENGDAARLHATSEAFKTFMSESKELLAKPSSVAFYKEVTA
ncbi:hypothetical protein FRB94_005926 [Tulasnella sp. JGI-2019a]|nr:hypothetical protein FRB93_005193 [Tulasnella sp. JGI-2019a]KAG8999793.1 hypothetical protein FRB94_005926 [Tulasnella sp. JGI-2019a]KAG9028306.1 hypothetical protein FRB95_006610 [Tulasnella sp. JGI-2019a]